MKDHLQSILQALADSPALFGIVAAVARWLLGDRDGGLWVFLSYLCSALLVAWGVALYVADEPFSSSRRGFYILLFAFAARDILTAILAITRELAADPVGLLSRVKAAMRGEPKS